MPILHYISPLPSHTNNEVQMKLLFSSLYFFFFFYATISNGAMAIVKHVTVDLHGYADFTRIQAAIDSVPDGNKEWIRIQINPGLYKEKVRIPMSKGFVILEGSDPKTTTIESDGHVTVPIPPGRDGYVLTESSTFISSADNVVLKGIQFKNTYRNNTEQRAVAAYISGDKTSIYNCEFIGIQDTLCDCLGRHYYKGWYIEGAIDIIFGFAQSIFEGCTISTVATTKVKAGWLTANGRQTETNTTGFVFKRCNVTGSGKAYLGRAWRDYARVLFYQTAMSDIVVPQGWDAWKCKDQGAHTTFAESGCTGPGSNTAGRVEWEKKLLDAEVDALTSLSFIDTEGWINQQPDDSMNYGIRKLLRNVN